MFKKLVVASALVLASSAAFAGSAYVGAGLGVSHQMFTAKEDADMIDMHSKSNFGGTGALLNLNAGYGAKLNQKIYLGGEVLVNATSANVKGTEFSTADDELTLKFKTKYTIGASIIPGVMVNDNTMAYARVGIVRSRFDVKTSGTGSFEGMSDSDQDSVTGGQFGLGLQTKLTQNVDLRGEYTYNTYRSFNSNGIEVNPSSGNATVGFIYKFV